MEKFFYRVEDGDTVFSVSQKFQIPPTLLIKQNCLKKEITCGDLLYIERCVGNFYAVKPFDTIEDISKKFCVSKDEILQNNGIDYLFYGLIIKI